MFPRIRRWQAPRGEALTFSQPDRHALLLAEDHDSIRDGAWQTLVNLGYRVLSAVDGEEALCLCESETPAMAILDIVMPKRGARDGGEARERLEKLPVLFTSGYSQESRGLDTKGRYLQKLTAQQASAGSFERYWTKRKRVASDVNLPRWNKTGVFAVDRCASQCYKAPKTSPLVVSLLRNSSASEAADLPGRAGCMVALGIVL